MNWFAQGALQSWSSAAGVDVSLLLLGVIYARGWFHLRRVEPRVFSVARLGAFVAGLASVWVALGSPLAEYDDASLTVHMIQHLLLMSVAPALFLLAAPALPLLHGMPQVLARNIVAPVLRWRAVQAVGNFLTRPAVAWLVAALTLMIWHVPQIFDLALRHEWLHKFEHASFLSAGLIFWWPVIQPWPSVARRPSWVIPLYLFAATLPCDALSGFLAFCDRVVYTSYLSAPRLAGISALQDQQRAAALMWTVVTFILMIPAVAIALQILSPERTRTTPPVSSETLRVYEPTR